MTKVETDESEALTAREEERLLAPEPRARFWSRSRFLAILVAVLIAHAALLLYLLYRDSKAKMETARLDETPIEVVVQPPPPEPPKPPPPEEKKQPPPPPPKQKEEIEKPAFSAPRAPNKETVDTKSTDAKTQAPKAPTPPQRGEKAPPQQASKPQEENKETAKEDAGAKPEALDKAKPKVARQSTAKPAKTKPVTKKTLDALASLSGESPLRDMTFAKPTPKSPVYGGTEDVRYLAIVQGMIMQKVRQLPRLSHYQEGGQVAVYFHIDDNGRVISQEILKKSGNPAIDSMAMAAVREAGPFPAPPRVVPHDLVWGSSVDGQLPIRVMR